MCEAQRVLKADRASVLVVSAAVPSVLVLALGLRGVVAVVCTLAGLGLSIMAARDVAATGRAPRVLWPTIAVLAVLSVLRAPMGSHDLWSYASYGRMVSEHGADPYRSVPATFPRDLVYPLVGWKHAPSGYGPLFTAYSVGVAELSGRSLLLLRWGFQLAAAASMLVCLGVLHRARRAAELTLVGLAPFVWVSVVNGGHNDAMVAAFVVVAVVCLMSARFAAFALLVGVAALIKLSAVFAAVPVVVMLVVRRQYRAAAIVSTGPVGAVALSLVFAPRSITNASTSTRDMVTRSSIWRPVSALTEISPTTITAVATAVIGVGMLAIAWQRRRDAEPGTGVGSSLSMYATAASYTLPWYLVWGLPALGLGADLVLVGMVAARGSLMLASYQLGGSFRFHDVVAIAISTIAPLALTFEFLRRALRRDTPPDQTAGPFPAPEPDNDEITPAAHAT